MRMHMCMCLFWGQKKKGVCLCFRQGGGWGWGWRIATEDGLQKREKEEKLCSQKSNDSLPKIDLSFYKWWLHPPKWIYKLIAVLLE